MRTPLRPLLAPLALALAIGGAPLTLSTDAHAQAAPAPAATPAGPTPAPPAQAQAITQQVQAFYDRSSSFDADFKQEYWIKQYNTKKLGHGHVVFKKPGKMHWVFEEPKGNHLVSNGTKLKVYEAANNQMYEQDVSASQYPAVLSFLAGQGKLADAFDLQLFDGAQMNFPGGWVLVGVPKTPSAAYQKVFFYVDKQTAQVRRVLIVDGQGNHNRFDFERPRVDEKVDDSKFDFTPPPGTSIIHP